MERLIEPQRGSVGQVSIQEGQGTEPAGFQQPMISSIRQDTLDELIAQAGLRAAVLPSQSPTLRSRPNFRDAIAGRDQMHVIAEFKRCSPSRGDIRPYASVVDMVTAYQEGGASALSVLTEPTRFRGEDIDVQLAAAAVDLPILMKDFVVSPRQVEHAAVLGASAVLLIVGCLKHSDLLELAGVCRRLGLTPVVECHDEQELRIGLEIEDAVLGINHRDLRHMTIDPAQGRRLLGAVPDERVVVVESGDVAPEEIYSLHGLVDAVLVGSFLGATADLSF